MSYDVEIAEVAPQLIAATKVHTTLRQVGTNIGTGFGRLMQALAREGVVPSGSPLIVYHDVIDDETEGDLEVCVPVGKTISGNYHVYGRKLEGGTVATTVHHGPYEEIATAYHALTSWIAEHGHDVAGPPREIYLNDPQLVAPAELLTRLEFPVCRDAN